MSKIAYLNSKFVNFKNAKIHIEDRGLQFSDSVYEVVPFYNKKLIDFKFHIKRLNYSIKELQINYAIKENKLEKIFNRIILLSKLKNGLVYLQLTRGIQSRDHVFKKKLRPNLIIYAINRKLNLPDNNNFKGEKAITFNDLRWKRRDITSVSLLGNVLAKNAAAKKNAYEAIRIDNGSVTEAPATNVWIVKKNKLITHPTNTDILKGITRQSIKKLVQSNSLKLVEKCFTLKEMYAADEVFITSSGNFVTPIIKIDYKKINRGKIGKITLKLANLYMNLFRNE